MKKIKKAQTWSIELIATVVIFIVALVVFGSFMVKKDANPRTLINEGEKVSQYLSSEGQNSIISANELDEQKYINLNISKVKRDLNIPYNRQICIYLKDQDGKLVRVNGIAGKGDSPVKIKTIGEESCTE